MQEAQRQEGPLKGKAKAKWDGRWGRGVMCHSLSGGFRGVNGQGKRAVQI
jgi:hypothetical protein